MRRPLRSDEARELANMAIDLGDPGRMSRARKLHRAGLVGAVHVESGRLSTTVFEDDRALDVTVSLSLPLRRGTLVPDVSAVSTTTCGCEDDGVVCKHVLAAVLALAEEVEADPEVLQLWTGVVELTKRPTGVHTSESAEFLSGPFDPMLEPPMIQPIAIRLIESGQSGALVVEQVDAWPVFADALLTLMDDHESST